MKANLHIGIAAWLLLAPLNAAAPANYYRMKKATVMDERGFDRPVPAMTLLIPSDWQFQGNTQWGEFNGCTTSRVQTTFHAGRADGRLTLEMFPTYNWQWSDDSGTQRNMQMTNQQKAAVRGKPCDVMPPMSAADFVRRYVVPKLRPGKQVVAMEPVPDVDRQIQQTARQTEAQWARSGMPIKVHTDVVRARLQYTLNGQPVEEWIAAIVYANVRPWPTYNVATGRRGQAMHYDCGAYSVFALRAPQGELTSRQNFFKMILDTIRIDPNWQARVNGVSNNIAAAQQKGVRDRSAIVQKNSDEINKIIKDGYEGRQKIQDSSAESYSQTERGLETFRNPVTGDTVELSNLYGHAWANGNGEYILSDQAGFDPNVVLKEKWTALQPVKK